MMLAEINRTVLPRPATSRTRLGWGPISTGNASNYRRKYVKSALLGGFVTRSTSVANNDVRVSMARNFGENNKTEEGTEYGVMTALEEVQKAQDERVKEFVPFEEHPLLPIPKSKQVLVIGGSEEVRRYLGLHLCSADTVRDIVFCSDGEKCSELENLHHIGRHSDLRIEQVSDIETAVETLRPRITGHELEKYGWVGKRVAAERQILEDQERERLENAQNNGAPESTEKENGIDIFEVIKNKINLELKNMEDIPEEHRFGDVFEQRKELRARTIDRKEKYHKLSEKEENSGCDVVVFLGDPTLDYDSGFENMPKDEIFRRNAECLRRVVTEMVRVNSTAHLHIAACPIEPLVYVANGTFVHLDCNYSHPITFGVMNHVLNAAKNIVLDYLRENEIEGVDTKKFSEGAYYVELPLFGGAHLVPPVPALSSTFIEDGKGSDQTLISEVLSKEQMKELKKELERRLADVGEDYGHKYPSSFAAGVFGAMCDSVFPETTYGNPGTHFMSTSRAQNIFLTSIYIPLAPDGICGLFTKLPTEYTVANNDCFAFGQQHLLMSEQGSYHRDAAPSKKTPPETQHNGGLT